MEIDPEHVSFDLRSGAVRADVCVIGGGIAGLLLAHKLAESGTDVLLLEAGGLEGEPADASSPEAVRALGGTSLAWGGQLLPLPDTTGWPVSAAELQPYLAELERLFGVDTLPYEASTSFEAQGSALPGFLKQTSLWTPRFSKFAPFRHRNLGRTLGRALLRHTQARVALHAQALAVEVAPGTRRTSGVLVQTRAGRQWRVRASTVVVAAGTVETCRLLRASDAALAPCAGEGWRAVGRNLHNHLTVRAATFVGQARSQVLRHFQPWLVGGVRGTVHSLKLEVEQGLRSRLGIPFGMGHFAFEEPEDSGLAALRNVLRARQAGARANGLNGLRALPRSFGELTALHRSATEDQRRFVSARATVTLRLNLAQHLPTGSHLRPEAGRDGAGHLRGAVEWQVGSEDTRGLRAFARAMQEQLSALGCSEAEGAQWNRSLLQADGPVAELDDARHAMGGACMGADPRTSVVDPQLRVHGVENLYVASPAVFPDGRAQLPTLPLMALALRLADRLQAAQGRRR